MLTYKIERTTRLHVPAAPPSRITLFKRVNHSLGHNYNGLVIIFLFFLLQDITDSNDMTQLRSMTGVCPQHNILYDGLTCSEHLEIFGIIKGVSPDVIKEQVHKCNKQ